MRQVVVDDVFTAADHLRARELHGEVHAAEVGVCPCGDDRVDDRATGVVGGTYVPFGDVVAEIVRFGVAAQRDDVDVVGDLYRRGEPALHADELHGRVRGAPRADEHVGVVDLDVGCQGSLAEDSCGEDEGSEGYCGLLVHTHSFLSMTPHESGWERSCKYYLHYIIIFYVGQYPRRPHCMCGVTHSNRYNISIMSQSAVVSPNAKHCPHCGNNPIPHTQAWIDSSLCIVMAPITNTILETRFGKLVFRLTDHLIHGFLRLCLFLRIARFSKDHTLKISDRARVLMDEAHARGWGMETLLIFGRITDIFRITLPSGQQHIFSGLPRVKGLHDEALTVWIDDKALFKQYLEKESIRVSKGRSFSSWEDAKRYFETAEKPLIIKPRLGSRGRHTTTHIYTLEEFKKAFDVAKQLSHHVVVEEHLTGSVYRATVIDGELVGVLSACPPRITGDGVHTIAELIAMKNANRDARMGVVEVNNRLHDFLRKFSYSLETILPIGKTIDLTEKVGLSYGGSSRDETPYAHPALRAEFERAARTINDPFLGFDFITTDVSADPKTVRWGIIECNTVPFINLHHYPLEGVPINVAAKVLDYVERNV